jgi:hypothetical protein
MGLTKLYWDKHNISHSRSSFLKSRKNRTGLTQIIREALSGKQTGSRPMQALVLRCRSGPWKWGIASVCRKIYILSDSQVAIKALNNLQINSKLVFDCHQFLTKLAEHKRIQLLWVPGHMEIIVNEMVEQPARQGSSNKSTNEIWACTRLICKGAKGVIRGWRNYKHETYWQSIHGQKQAKGFPKRLPAKKAEALLNLSRNQLWTMTGLLTGQCNFKRCLHKLGISNSPECDRCKQASEMVLCDLRFRMH